MITGLAAVIFLAVGVSPALAETWEETKGKHFEVYYQQKSDRRVAEKILRRAEDYYRKIGDQIGYTRYADFWTWEDRAKIFLFPDQASFQETTGQPAWSIGYSDRDSYLFRSRAIVTYKQESGLLDSLLPHEISHLILHDYIPVAHLPIWFDEGVAQLQESYKSEEAQKIMRFMVRHGQHIQFSVLSRLDIRGEQDSNNVTVFYAQSLSIVEFLIKKYGSAAFGRLCRNLRDGKTFDEALRNAYTRQIESIADLEAKWVNYMNR